MLVTILTAAEVVYVVVLAIWILLEKRPAVSTLAWIFSLIALPYVGFLVFFFLGPRRLTRKRHRHRRARGKSQRGSPKSTREELTLGCGPVDDPRLLQLDRLAMNTGEPPVDVCENVEIYADAESTYRSIEAAIASAKHHVHVAYYIFDSGRAGTRLCDALVARATAGIIVRVLVDDVGSSAMTRAMIRRMRDAGIKFAKFNEVAFSRLRGRIDFRNHRKIVVCDGAVGFTGGINVCDDYVPEAAAKLPDIQNVRAQRKRRRRGQPAPWRDSHVRLEGDAVRWLQLMFLEDWAYSTTYVARDKEYFPPPTGKGPHRVQIVGSGPDRELEPIQKLYFVAMTIATERVWVTTPYFVPDDAIFTALTTAALRGVDVRILVPRRSDSIIVTAAARSYYDDVLACGARIYEYQPTMIHAKTVLIDDFFAAVGTANMDNRSFRLNFECTSVLYGTEHAAVLAAHFENDLASSKEITREIREHLRFEWKLAEAIARVASPIL